MLLVFHFRVIFFFLTTGPRTGFTLLAHETLQLSALVLDFAKFIGLETSDGLENLSAWHRRVSARESAKA